MPGTQWCLNMPVELTVKSMKQTEVIVVLLNCFPLKNQKLQWPKYVGGKKQCEDIHCQVHSQRHTPPLAQGTASKSLTLSLYPRLGKYFYTTKAENNGADACPQKLVLKDLPVSMGTETPLGWE